MTIDQYLSGFLLISSEHHKNFTFFKSIPEAFHISIKYFPTVHILSKSPSNFKFKAANQSATQNRKIPPAFVSLFTFTVFNNPYAICIHPDGSNPS